MVGSIYVQIASYRDEQLPLTVADCLEKARFPDRLTFGIAWQYGHGENPDLYDHDSRFRVIKIPSQESRGACWARSICNQAYQGEDFVLQVDSHTRFTEDWDAVIVDCWERLQNPRGVFTCYPAGFKPWEPPSEWHRVPLVIRLTSIRSDVDARPDRPHPSTPTGPWKARHFGAGFVFSTGAMVTEVPYDPSLYFRGEETSMAIRLFSHGFDLYHPDRHICWHYYTRKDVPHHWSEVQGWEAQNSEASLRLRSLLGKGGHDLGIYGIGSVRSLADWVNYSGIDYRREILHLDVLENLPPPVDLSDPARFTSIPRHFTDLIFLDFEKLKAAKDARYWAVIVKDQHGRDLHRQDVKRKEFPELFDGSLEELEIGFDYYPPKRIPSSVTIAPMGKNGWMPFVSFPIGEVLVCGPRGLSLCEF